MDIYQKTSQDEQTSTMNNTKILVTLILLFLTGCSSRLSFKEGLQKSRRGDKLFAAGDIDGAVNMWRESLNYKRNPELYEKIVMVMIVKNDLPQAEKWTSEGLTYFPNNVNLLFNNALVKFHSKDFSGAVDSLNRILELNSYYPNAHLLKGMIYEELDDTTSAKKEFVQEININPGSKTAWQKLRGLTNE